MAFVKQGKRKLIFGRRPRGRAKGLRSGPVPSKHRRRQWFQAPGESGKRTAAPQRRIRPSREGVKTYGPFKVSA